MRFPLSRLGIKLALWSSLIVFLIIGAGSYWEYREDKKDLEGWLLKHLNEEASALRGLVKQAEDERQVQAILDTFLQGIGGHNASIVDAQGVVLASTYPEWVGRALEEVMRLDGLEELLAGRKALAVNVMVHNGVKVMTISIPLLRDGKIIGAVHLSEPYTKVEERLRALVVRRLLFGFALVAGLLLFLNLALAEVVVLPVRKLSRAMEEVEEKGLEVQVAVPSTDEVGQLVASFKRML
ncbi:MAG: HAMP domain-containing protein, partial [Candidatus Methylomirabilales bacterium]